MVTSRFHNTRSGIMREEYYLCLYDHVLTHPTSYLDEMACEVNSFHAENCGLPTVSLATICRAFTVGTRKTFVSFDNTLCLPPQMLPLHRKRFDFFLEVSSMHNSCCLWRKIDY